MDKVTEVKKAAKAKRVIAGPAAPQALYKEIGLVNTRVMFEKAMAGKYAVPAYNFNNMEQLQAIVMGCVESDSPFILQVSSGARKYANQTLLRWMAQGAVEVVKSTGSEPEVRPAPGPRRHVRTVQVVHRDRLLVGHDRRFAPSLRKEHRGDAQGGRVRASLRCNGRRRAGRSCRHRG